MYSVMKLIDTCNKITDNIIREMCCTIKYIPFKQTELLGFGIVQKFNPLCDINHVKSITSTYNQ